MVKTTHLFAVVVLIEYRATRHGNTHTCPIIPLKASFLVRPANFVTNKRVIMEIVYVGIIKRLD
jgi:hypothetical protein